MKRTRLHALNPESARKRIKAAKSNEPFMAALLDRGHRGHKDAVDQWTRLHQVAFADADSANSMASPANQRRAANGTPDSGTHRRSNTDRNGNRANSTGTGAMQPGTSRMKTADLQLKPKRSDRRESQASVLLPDPNNPLQVDSAGLSSLSRQSGENESDWLGRLDVEIGKAFDSLEPLLVIREAILHEIGFYDLEPGRVGADDLIASDEWRVLAVLQNTREDGWRDARLLGAGFRQEFEQTGLMPTYGALGPDGNVYHRLTFGGTHPVGDLLQVVEQRIDEQRPHDPDSDLARALLAVGIRPGGGLGSVGSRSIFVNLVAPRVNTFIRSRGQAASAGLAMAAGLRLSGSTRRDGHDGSEMEPAPDLPPLPSFEPPEGPDTGRETLPADLPPIPPLPGFMPEDYPDLVEIFPDQRGELPLVDILDDRLGNDDTRRLNTDVMSDVRDLAESIDVEVDHIGGGQPDPKIDRREPELYLRPSGGGRAGGSYLDVAFKSTRTNRRLLINTVDTRTDNVTLTGREERAAVRILANSETGDILILIPKPPRGQAYDRDHLLEWLRPHLEEIDRDLPEGSEGHERRFEFR